MFKDVAKSFGIDISRVNENQRLSGRDYIQRERRASHKLLFKKSVFQHHDQLGNFTQKIGQRLPLNLNIGKNTAPQSWIRNKISKICELEE